MAKLVYFTSVDSKGQTDLFVTDGLAADTVPVGGIGDASVAGSPAVAKVGYAGGLDPAFTASFGDRVLFAGSDDSRNTSGSLWVSDATAAGTYEVGGVDNAGVSGAFASGLNPSDIFAFGGKAIFSGIASDGNTGLWITDGTAAGTFELGGQDNAGVPGAPLDATLSFNSIASLGNAAIFTGPDASGSKGLWITDGTNGGTGEIFGYEAPIKGLSVAESVYAVLNGMTIFSGKDSNYPTAEYGLWVTNGTTSGTQEIGGVNNLGVFGDNTDLGEVSGWVEVNGRMIFASGNHLWSTDGTAAGTVEIGGVNDAGVGAYSTGLAPTALKVCGNGVVFVGRAKDGSNGLWYTDGTTAGTYEIGGVRNEGVAGAPSTGLSLTTTYDVSRPLGNKLVFSSLDASGAEGLWVTDGTAAGTSELGGLADAGIAGAAATGLNATNLVIDGAQIFFMGQGVSGSSLWVTDGTTAGTHKVTSASVSDLAVAGSATGAANAPDDYTGADVSDIVWQGAANGDVYEWLMNAGEHVNNVYLGLTPGWSDVGSAAFGANGVNGILWQNQTTGVAYEWGFSNGDHVSDTYLGDLQGWTATAVGSFYGAGSGGVVWRDAAGDAYEWKIAGDQHVGGDVYLGNTAGWSEIATGDFNGDGTADMLWRNDATGALYEWSMSGGQRAASISLGSVSGFTLIGTGDFNGDGTSDLLWKNDSSGEVWEWQMNASGQNGQSLDLGNLSGYTLAATGDYAGHGVDGMVWQNTTTGDIWLWSMNQGQHLGSTYLGQYSGWTAA